MKELIEINVIDCIGVLFFCLCMVKVVVYYEIVVLMDFVFGFFVYCFVFDVGKVDDRLNFFFMRFGGFNIFYFGF